MPTLSRVSTTDMEVTSIRLERDLKLKLKALAGDQGYQTLIREVLWKYVEAASGESRLVDINDIRVSMQAVAQREEHCALTGKTIQPQEDMLLGLTSRGNLVPLSLDSLKQT